MGGEPVTIPAVAYLRMSDSKQGESIATQREAVEKLAKKGGYLVLKEYVDEGISGDDTEKRTAFLRMRQDAARGEFAAVLCWDQDRFGRFDTLDAGFWVKPLRDAGVQLVTVAQGQINWEDFTGRLMYSIQQEGKHQFLRDMSRNVARGMLAKARRGEWLGGAPPYGYALEGKRLVPGDPEEVRVVRWLFSEYGPRGRTLGMLCDELNAAGTPGPGGKLWLRTSAHRILTRPLYAGVVAWNRRHAGKYHAVKGGEIAATARTKQVDRASDKKDWVCVEAPHLALVDAALFESVQRRLVANRDSCTPKRNGDLFYLTGLLVCENCGWPMYGHTSGNCLAKRYICGNYNQHRRRGGCKCNTVREDSMLDLLARTISAHFARPEVRDALRAEIRRQEEAERRGAADPVAALGARITALDRKIDQGTEKWLTAPPSLTVVLGAKLEQWRQERERLHAERRELSKPAPTVEDLDDAVDRVLGGMDRLRELMDADPHGAKAMLKEVVEKVECRFRHVPYGSKRERSVLDGGTVVIREDVLLCRPVPLGRPW
jgi:DNA invertase Pin-like site-specific DNA recombinase